MNASRLFCTLALILGLMPLPAAPQGFAGLGAEAEGYATPVPGRAFRFPDDHGAHPGYRIEWWYVTANLRDDAGHDYGVQWTLFRSALRPGGAANAGWSTPQLWLGHAAVTTARKHLVAERLSRGGTGAAGVEASPFAAWIDDWQMAGDTPERLSLRAGGTGFAYDLSLAAQGPLVAQGDAGYSVKSAAGQASHYYSQPFYSVTGTVTLSDRPDGPVQVTGQAWLDREWSSQPLAQTQTGWDWFSLHLEDGEKLMAFRLRQNDGGDYLSATWIAADGTPTPLAQEALRLTPLQDAEVAGRRIPVRWRIEVPERGLRIETRPLNPQAWMDTRFPYWEGPVFFDGTQSGRGYLEMTGYD